MKIYILKLKATSTTNYNLYDGTTLVSDSDLATLFATAGEAYFQFDFNSLTPTDTTSLTILDSQDTVVMTNTGLTGIAEGKNFKGVWDNSATSFTSFTQLEAYGLDEAQLGELASLAKSGEEIITKEITAHVNAWSFFGGADAVGKIFRVRNNTNNDRKIYFDSTTSGTDSTHYVGAKKYSDTYFIFMLQDDYNGHSFVAIEPHGAPGETGATNAPVLAGGFYGSSLSNPQVRRMQIGAIDNLTTTSIDDALSANQGRILKGYADSLRGVGTVYASTSSTAPTYTGETWTQIGSQTVGSSTVYYYERTA